MTVEETPTGAARGISRRALLRAGVAAGTLGPLLRPGGARLIESALAGAEGVSGGLKDVEHVVLLMQENRSFDHYFGTMSGVRGFADPDVLAHVVGGQRHSVFDQFGYRPGKGVDKTGYLEPFRLVSDPPRADGQTLNDLNHDWGPQHECWNGGRMDKFVTAHIEADGPDDGPVTMGYYTRAELPFYYALADAFTIADAYHCSLFGPTIPNRLMAMSATIDPDGKNGGPICDNLSGEDSLTWESMPERLTAAGVTWKGYCDPSSLAVTNPMQRFKALATPTTADDAESARRMFSPAFPADFAADVASGSLPAVSWLFPNIGTCEHPALPPAYGEWVVQQVLDILVSNPDVWAKTALIVSYDENGGFFDHVLPPTPAEGTPGEWLTVHPLPDTAAGIAGPIGLGFRVPCLVISPFSRGGWVATERFDHTSQLRFLESRFGVEVPNLSAWRRSVTGDLTSTFGFDHKDTSVPALPETSIGDLSVAEQVAFNALSGVAPLGSPYPLPEKNHMPSQAHTPKRRHRRE